MPPYLGLILFGLFAASFVANSVHRRVLGGDQLAPQLSLRAAKTWAGAVSRLGLVCMIVTVILSLLGVMDTDKEAAVILATLALVNLLSVAHRHSVKHRTAT